MHLLGVDIGTSRTKAIVFSESGEMKSYAVNDYSLSRPRPDWSEMDAEFVWGQISKTIRESVQSCGLDPSEINAISISALVRARAARVCIRINKFARICFHTGLNSLY